MEDKQKKAADEQNKDAAVKPDKETLHTTDPQEHMKGPISSAVHSVEKTVEEVGKKKGDEE